MQLPTIPRPLTGNKVGLAIQELHRSENSLAATLLRMSDRHKADHEIHHVARDVARWSHAHIRELARVGEDYGVDLDPEPKQPHQLVSRARQVGAEMVGHLHAPGLLLLWDLREVHRMAAGVSLDWEVLAQTAQAMKDRELLHLSEECHPQTLRQMQWANAMLKVMSAQFMVTG